ncbi:hypothetical protein HYH02_005135 [Chlamydomonas schloesseri]|uniref:Leucine-rich repeat-containing N-terminal plant-type domain-containing protein n=1 Tax=Chlamydomonas schloesseri TaxID=2026947 RepID=A0A836B745_9CHLO|nr:hypothetical protein HYH02_005135 [Chlamydomonas schloesseri]|eukprot:KAG2449602.1 hypothetical protein HYH02_005135 [Chlamydomonas schloesseri]
MARVLLFGLLLAIYAASVAFARNSQASPPGGIARSSQATLPEDVDAARALLLSLLGADAAANATVVWPLMPRGTDPCTPTADDWAAWAAVNGVPAAGPEAAAWAAKGACGPQWSVANPTTDTTNPSGGSWRRSRRLHDVARRMLQPGSGSAATSPSAALATVPAGAYMGGPPACAWKWLSCSSWRIVAVNVSCGSATRGSGVCTLPRLRGSLPGSTPGLSALASLDVSGQASLTGGLPLSLWTTPWSSLQILNMSYAGLSGGLPADWSDLPALTVLDLSMNNIKGTLPSGMAALSGLRWLSLAGNSGLNGYLPSAWAALGSLVWLDVRSVCRLCGTTDMFGNLTSALTAGSHVNTRCRPDECDLDIGNLHSIFQGVLAGFASVMGLCAIVLVLRRIRDCTSGRSHRGMRLSVGPSSRSHRGSSGGGASGERGNGAAGSDGAGGAGAGGNGRTRSRRTRSHRRRGPGTTAASVPLYVVEFEADGTCKWALQVVRAEDVRLEIAGGGAAAGSDALARQQLSPAEVELSAAARTQEGTQPSSEGAAAPAALPPNSAEPDEGTAGAGPSSSAAAGGGSSSQPDSSAEAAARIIAEAISNGEAAEAAARAKEQADGLLNASEAARPPDAVILQPDGFEVCLGSRVAAPPAVTEAEASAVGADAEAPAGGSLAGDGNERARRQDSGADTCGSGSGESETTGDDTPSAAGRNVGAGSSGGAGPSNPPSAVDTSSVSCTLSSSCTDSFNPSTRGGAGSGRPDA